MKQQIPDILFVIMLMVVILVSVYVSQLEFNAKEQAIQQLSLQELFESRIDIIEYDGHEYILYRTQDPSTSGICHKASCKYCNPTKAESE